MEKQGMSQWRGRVALVTGGSSGIGRGIVQRLRQEGMRVAACGRREEPLALLAEELGTSHFLPIQADLVKQADIAALFAALEAKWGGPDVLINSAGVGVRAPLLDGDAESWRAMFELNVLALSTCTSEAISRMRKTGVDGHVIHISSMGAYRVPPRAHFYSATKHAVRALTEGLRQELREAESKIRISSISPGFVETEMLASHLSANPDASKTHAGYPRLTPEDIAELAITILSAPPHVQVHDLLVRPRDQPH